MNKSQPKLSFFQTRDGLELFVRRWEASASPVGQALILHGIGEHGGRYAHVAEFLVKQGFEVITYDQRGFGRSGGVRGSVPYQNALLDDASEFAETLRSEHASDDTLPLLLIGHSMGGAFAARLVADGAIRPQALLLAAPALRPALSRANRAKFFLAERLKPDLAAPNGLPIDALSRDKEVVAAYRADPFTHEWVTARTTRSIIEAGEVARQKAAEIDIPTLVLVAGSDQLVENAACHEFVRQIPDDLGEKRTYPGAYHELFNEPEPTRTNVFDDIRVWLKSHFGHASEG